MGFALMKKRPVALTPGDGIFQGDHMNLRTCPFLTGKYFKACTVSKEAYVPSAFETGEYCTSGRHTMCSLFGKRQFEQVPMSVENNVAVGARSS